MDRVLLGWEGLHIDIQWGVLRLEGKSSEQHGPEWRLARDGVFCTL